MFEALYTAGRAKEAIGTIMGYVQMLAAETSAGRMSSMQASVGASRAADSMLKIWPPSGEDPRAQRMQQQLAGWCANTDHVLAALMSIFRPTADKSAQI